MSAARHWQSDPDPESPIARLPSAEGERPAAQLLGEELRRHRESLGYTLAAAARAIRGSTSKLSRLERGESPAKARDVYDLADFYRLSRKDMAYLEQLLAQAANAEWYERFADVTPHFLKRLIRMEGRAEEITIFENQVVPGLLQTARYAEALVRMMQANAFSEAEIVRTVALRKARQIILDQEYPRITVLLDQTVLDRKRGDADVMCEQMDYLLVAADKPKVNVRIVSKDALCPPTAITYLQFPDGVPGDLAYLENIEGATYATRQRSLDNYRKVLSDVRNGALGLKESIAAIQKAADYWGKKAPRER
ncbi:helix-turn-helix domain-containing protein [Streptomyces olivaceoviridis]|uniref:helix-turn-helix domain-containing protein n=1 Tax=Streptomyces olivaceoviridis TaxID=1921 RepID=UPI0036B85FD9